MAELQFVDHVPEGQPNLAILRPGSSVVVWLVTEDSDLSLPYQVEIGAKLNLTDQHSEALTEALVAAGGIRGLLVTLPGEAAQL